MGTVLLSDKILKYPLPGLIVTLLITAVATCYSFNVNLWFLRNLIIIGNLEASFLDFEDYNKLIPKSWRPPYRGKFFSFKEFPSMLGFIYPLFTVLVVLYYWKDLNCRELILLVGFSFIVLVLVVIYICILFNRFMKIKKDAPGPIGEDKSP